MDMVPTLQYTRYRGPIDRNGTQKIFESKIRSFYIAGRRRDEIQTMIAAAAFRRTAALLEKGYTIVLRSECLFTATIILWAENYLNWLYTLLYICGIGMCDKVANGATCIEPATQTQK
jgi:hypothetical protein